MSQLNTKTPLSDNIDRICEFVNVRRYESLRVSAKADVASKVVLEWSPDGLEKALESLLLLPAEQWKTEKFEKLMPFVRLHLINTSGKPNKVLQVITEPVGGVSTPSHAIDASAEDKKNKSPLRRFMDKKSKKSAPVSVSSSDPSRDSRLPDYIPQGTILIGGKSGKVTCIARGNPGDVLTVDKEGNICWMPPASLVGFMSSVSSLSKSGSSSARSSILHTGSFGNSKQKISFSSIQPVEDNTNTIPDDFDLSKLGILDAQ